MYPKVNFPKKPTDQWLRLAFAPLSDYLRRMYPNEAEEMMMYLSFQCNENQRFYYRNSMTKDSIIFDQEGRLISCGEEALRYDFHFPEGKKVNRLPKGERFVHPNVARWMTKRMSHKANAKYGEEVSIFCRNFGAPL